MVMFLFLVIALVVVVAGVTLAVVSGGDSGPLPDADPERLRDSLPPTARWAARTWNGSASRSSSAATA